MADVKEINVGGVSYDIKDVTARNFENTLAGSIATIETEPATASHAVGEYIVYNGQLYEVTSAITAGDSLTGNISAVSVADALEELSNKSVNTVTSTGTTSSSGALLLPTVAQGGKFLSARCTSQTNVYAFDRGDNYLTVFTVTNNTMTVLANTSVTLLIKYVEI